MLLPENSSHFTVLHLTDYGAPYEGNFVASLRALEHDETLIVQSGKPVAVFRTQPEAPRVLIANSNLVGRWATWDVFRELERKGLMMYG